MINLTQMMTLEIGSGCNFSEKHKDLCPNTHMNRRTDRTLTDEMIINASREAYFELGFEGLISFQFYNEPMLYWRRMLDLMVEIRNQVPQSRFFLWTNGSVLIKDPRMALFELTHISNYLNKPIEELVQYFYNLHTRIGGGQPLDERLTWSKAEENDIRCLMPFDNFIISNSGDLYICCIDWRNEVKIGNLFDSSLKELDEKRQEYIKTICGEKMTADAHIACRTCPAKWNISNFDKRIRDKALKEFGSLV